MCLWRFENREVNLKGQLSPNIHQDLVPNLLSSLSNLRFFVTERELDAKGAFVYELEDVVIYDEKYCEEPVGTRTITD
jgi:hypothetical protein